MKQGGKQLSLVPDATGYPSRFVLKLNGLKKKSFNSAVQYQFKELIARQAGDICGIGGADTCKAVDVSILSYSTVQRRQASAALRVDFQITTYRAALQSTASSAVQSYLEGDVFLTDLQSQGGGLARATSFVLISSPEETSSSSEDKPVVMIMIILLSCLCTIGVCWFGFKRWTQKTDSTAWRPQADIQRDYEVGMYLGQLEKNEREASGLNKDDERVAPGLMPLTLPSTKPMNTSTWV